MPKQGVPGARLKMKHLQLPKVGTGLFSSSPQRHSAEGAASASEVALGVLEAKVLLFWRSFLVENTTKSRQTLQNRNPFFYINNKVLSIGGPNLCFYTFLFIFKQQALS